MHTKVRSEYRKRWDCLVQCMNQWQFPVSTVLSLRLGLVLGSSKYSNEPLACISGKL
jgi:hypothetical protein